MKTSRKEILMTPLRIKDNSSNKKELFADIQNLLKKIVNKTLLQLEREGVFVFPRIIGETSDLTHEQMILKEVNDTYRSGNIMGFIGYGSERLILCSRFCIKDNDYFLQYLLDKVVDIPNIVNLDTDAHQEHRFFDLVLFLFPYYLKQAMRKGVFKKYVQNYYNNESVKGSIDIARHININTPFIGKIAYSQREFSFDNALTELVRHTIEYLKRKPFCQTLLNKVKDEVKLIIDATPTYEPYDKQKILDLNMKKKVRHAYFKEYLDLQKLCILILQNQKYQIGTGFREIYGILFDGAWLWEEYVNTLIGDYFYHPTNKTGGGAQWLFKAPSGLTGLIYPDFIGKDKHNRIIADAKYKPMENIGNRDYQQILSYMFRFDANTGYYLYPESGSSDELILHLNRGSSYENVQSRDDIKVIKHGFKIPQSSANYNEFIQEMKAQEKLFAVFK